MHHEDHDEFALNRTPEQQAAGASVTRPGMFVGPYGLRAVWGVLGFQALLFALAAPFGATAISIPGQVWDLIAAHQASGGQHANPVPSELMPGQWIASEMLLFAMTVLVTFLLSHVERRPMRVYGLGTARLRDALPGAMWGVATLSLLVGLLHAFHLLSFDGVAVHGLPALRFGVEWLAMFLFVGLFEEYLMRGYMQFTLTRGFFGLAGRMSPARRRAVAFWLAALVMSLLFALAHMSNGGENALGLLMVFLVGMVFSYALWHTGSLWWGVGFHMAWDWAQSFLWGVPDSGGLCAGRLLHTHAMGNPLLSGGSDGPEGSVLAIPVLLLVVFAIRLARPGEQPPLETLESSGLERLSLPFAR